MSDAATMLVPANVGLRDAFREMALEYRELGDSRYDVGIDDFSKYLADAQRFRLGVDLAPHLVPSSEFWLVKNRRILGRVSVRHRLNPNLEIEGGHIGYDIRPSERLKGYGTLILRLALDEARKLGIRRALVTCNSENVGSAKIIERNGGVFERNEISPRTGKQINQYWIELG